MASLARITMNETRTRVDQDVPAPTLSSLEWKVVSLAIREAGEAGCGGAKPTSWLGRLFRHAAGVAPKMPLADPRLETLRRFVCRVRARADVSDLINMLRELGFTQNQITAVALLAR